MIMESGFDVTDEPSKIMGGEDELVMKLRATNPSQSGQNWDWAIWQMQYHAQCPMLSHQSIAIAKINMERL